MDTTAKLFLQIQIGVTLISLSREKMEYGMDHIDSSFNLDWKFSTLLFFDIKATDQFNLLAELS